LTFHLVTLLEKNKLFSRLLMYYVKYSPM